MATVANACSYACGKVGLTLWKAAKEVIHLATRGRYVQHRGRQPWADLEFNADDRQCRYLIQLRNQVLKTLHTIQHGTRDARVSSDRSGLVAGDTGTVCRKLATLLNVVAVLSYGTV